MMGLPVEQLRRMAADPAEFRRALLIDTDQGPRPLADVCDPWQAADFAALDPGWRVVAGQPVQDAKLRGYLERPRGHSKTADLAAMAAFGLFASPVCVNGVAAAADLDQGRQLRDAIKRLASLNPWLADVLEVQSYRVLNRITESDLTILSADAGSSYGLTPHFLIADELTHWPKADLWHSLLSAAAKRRGCLLLVISNAGVGQGTSWQWAVREHFRTHRTTCHFRRLDGPVASWITEDRLQEQQQLLPLNAYRRLWLNLWTAATGDAIDELDLRAAIVLDGPQLTRDPGWFYFAGLDAATKRDRIGLVVVGVQAGSGKIRVVYSRSWRPNAANPEENEREIEGEVRQAYDRYKFHQCRYDPWGLDVVVYRLRLARAPMVAAPLSGHNLNDTALALSEAFRTRAIEIPDDPQLIADLQAVSIRESADGFSFKLTAPRTTAGHADAALALSLVLPIALHYAKKVPPGRVPFDGTHSRITTRPYGAISNVDFARMMAAGRRF